MVKYIPGDLVTIETESMKPRVVKVSNVDEDSVIYCEGWGEVCFYDEIKPIPLTKDILLRNGWKVSRDSLLLKIDDNATLGIVFAFEHKRCCGNCLWMGREDILGNGWCYKKDCETSCDKVCKKHEF